MDMYKKTLRLRLKKDYNEKILSRTAYTGLLRLIQYSKSMLKLKHVHVQLIIAEKDKHPITSTKDLNTLVSFKQSQTAHPNQHRGIYEQFTLAPAKNFNTLTSAATTHSLLLLQRHKRACNAGVHNFVGVQLWSLESGVFFVPSQAAFERQLFANQQTTHCGLLEQRWRLPLCIAGCAFCGVGGELDAKSGCAPLSVKKGFGVSRLLAGGAQTRLHAELTTGPCRTHKRTPFRDKSGSTSVAGAPVRRGLGSRGCLRAGHKRASTLR